MIDWQKLMIRAGGACVPPLTGKVADMHNNTGVAMIVPLMVSFVALSLLSYGKKTDPNMNSSWLPRNPMQSQSISSRTIASRQTRSATARLESILLVQVARRVTSKS